jgi:glycosyltransferase involved in cell wall biosynthesis
VPASRLLIVGWLNSPHVLAWADAMLERGWEVHLAGEQVDGWGDAVPAGLASVHPFPRLGPPGFAARRLVPRLAEIARATAPAVTHAHWVTSFGWIAARARLRPLVVSAWGSDLLRPPRLARHRNRVALRAADLVLADSRHLAGAARALTGSATPVEVVNWGIDLDRFTPADGDERAALRARAGIAGPVVLSTRDLKPLYNIPVLLDAFARVRAAMPTATLVLKHPMQAVPAEITDEIGRLDLRDAVVTVGRTDLDELRRWYRVADAAVSIPDTDSSPRSVWEALACGCPVVVSDLPWAREGLTAGARRVQPDAGAVAGALLELLGDPTNARAAGAEGRRLVERRMDRRVEMDRVDALYRALAT